MAEGIMCERLGLPMDGAVVALADLAITRGVSLVEMAREIVLGTAGLGADIDVLRGRGLQG